ncbi:MAG: hypothetical protein GQ547_06750, partial [Methylophaga sp.]|nr:hypothetical protein [Methylophaga sp.]
AIGPCITGGVTMTGGVVFANACCIVGKKVTVNAVAAKIPSVIILGFMVLCPIEG